MAKINIYETEAERERRELHSNIRREYLISYLANKYGRSVMGVKGILKQAGIYKSAKDPVVLANNQPTQMTLGF